MYYSVCDLIDELERGGCESDLNDESVAAVDAVPAVADLVDLALIVAKIGWDMAWHRVQELADAALEVERVEAIRDAIADIDGIEPVSWLSMTTPIVEVEK